MWKTYTHAVLLLISNSQDFVKAQEVTDITDLVAILCYLAASKPQSIQHSDH